MVLKVALVATAKDEGPFVLEWVAYHRLAGFDPIIIYQNDSTDGTADHAFSASAQKAIEELEGSIEKI